MCVMPQTNVNGVYTLPPDNPNAVLVRTITVCSGALLTWKAARAKDQRHNAQAG